MTADAPRPLLVPKEDPERLELRGRPRPVVRFRRGLIVAIAATGSASLIGLAWMALDAPRMPALQSVGPATTEETAEGAAIEGAPRHYGEVPKLGPPLPGDLGRPILEQQRRSGLEGERGVGEAEAARLRAREAERQRLEAERLAALRSDVLVRLERGTLADGNAAAGTAPEQPSSAGTTSSPPAVLPDPAVASPPDGSSGWIAAPRSPWMLGAGTIIPASLVTGLNSDLPGTVVAQVTEDVRDSATGRTVLVPQGSRLVGRMDAKIGFGQRRATVEWTRLLLPDGASVELRDAVAADGAGHVGLADRVDGHGWRIARAVALSSLLGVGTELSLGDESELVRAARESAQQSGTRAGEQMVARNLDVPPTITVRPGWPVRIILREDLVLRPWRR